MPEPPRAKSYRQVRGEVLRQARVTASADPSVQFARFNNGAVRVRFKDGTDKVLLTAERRA